MQRRNDAPPSWASVNDNARISCVQAANLDRKAILHSEWSPIDDYIVVEARGCVNLTWQATVARWVSSSC